MFPITWPTSCLASRIPFTWRPPRPTLTPPTHSVLPSLPSFPSRPSRPSRPSPLYVSLGLLLLLLLLLLPMLLLL